MSKLQTVIIKIQGACPEPAEAERLSRLRFKGGGPGEAEVKESLKWFFIGLLVGIALFFFGQWVIRSFVGLGVLFFGYGGAYIAAPIMVIFGFSSLFKLLRSARKKKAANAFKWAWMVSVLGDDASGTRFGKLSYSISTMRRLIPKETGFNEQAFGDYVTALHAAMSNAADETAVSLKNGGWHETGPNKAFKITEEKELLPYLHELKATITYNDQLALSVNNKTRYMVSAMLELHITQYFIRAGKYWFPYDVMPAFQRETGKVIQGIEREG